MQFIQDVKINWIEKPFNHLLIPYYYEWGKDDNIDIFQRIPVIKVSDLLFEAFLENFQFKIPIEILKLSLNQSYRISDNKRINEPNCFIITSSSHDTLAVNTKGTNYALLKSRIPPIQEQIIKNIISEETFVNINETYLNHNTYFDEILSDYNNFIGLTRREKTKKVSLFLELKKMHNNKESVKLAFLLSEFEEYNFDEILKLDSKTIHSKLTMILKDNWNDNHEKILKYLFPNKQLL